jgi:serine/threonine protein kinase
MNCKSLIEINFESDCSLTRIESRAFCGSRVTAVAVPRSVIAIGDLAFGRCLSLSRVAFMDDSALKQVSSTAFSQCPLLVKLSFPAGARIVESISEHDLLDDSSKNRRPIRRRWRQPPSNRNLSDCVTDFEDYEFVEEIGRGSFSIVDRFHNRKTGIDLAVKSFHQFCGFEGGHDWMSVFIREIEILLQMSHPCIVSLAGYSMPTKDHPARLATFFVDGCSLSSVLMSNSDWWAGTVKSIAVVGIVIGMNYVHSRGIVHRDLKPSNILLDKETHQVHICDFGSSRLFSVESTLTQRIGTPQYMAPEMYGEEEYDFKVDVFAFGLILYEILTNNPVFGSKLGPRQIMRMVLTGERPNIPDNIPAFVKSMIRSCWSTDRAARFSFAELFKILDENEFKICVGVDPAQVRLFIKSVE